MWYLCYLGVCVCSVTWSYLTLCDLVDYSSLGSSVHGISQAGNWTGLPFPSPGNLPNPGIKSVSLALAGRFFTVVPPGKPWLLRWSVTKSKISLRPACTQNIGSVQFSSVAQSCLTLCPHGLQNPRLPCPPIPRAYMNSCPLRWWCHLATTQNIGTTYIHTTIYLCAENSESILYKIGLNIKYKMFYRHCVIFVR